MLQYIKRHMDYSLSLARETDGVAPRMADC